MTYRVIFDVFNTGMFSLEYEEFSGFFYQCLDEKIMEVIEKYSIILT